MIWEWRCINILVRFVSEVFDGMALLEEIIHEHNGGLLVTLEVLNDLLAVFINFTDAVVHPELHSICCIWVMKEYGLPESWTKWYPFETCGLVAKFDGACDGNVFLESNFRKLSKSSTINTMGFGHCHKELCFTLVLSES